LFVSFLQKLHSVVLSYGHAAAVLSCNRHEKLNSFILPPPPRAQFNEIVGRLSFFLSPVYGKPNLRGFPSPVSPLPFANLRNCCLHNYVILVEGL